MRLALFSDIHGNSVGLRAVLDHLAAQGGADAVYALGDILAPGPGAEDVLDMLDSVNATMLRGNWDELFIDPHAYIAALPSNLHDSSWAYYQWLTENLAPASQQRLAHLPLSISVLLPNGEHLFLCHAAPTDTSSPTCTATIDAAVLRATYGALDASIVAYGHYHAHHLIRLDQKLLLNVASVGMTYGKPSAYTLIDAYEDRLVVQQFQVPYDREEYQRLLRLRGVPVLAGQQV
jgi:predicted phosphodiesterase